MKARLPSRPTGRAHYTTSIDDERIGGRAFPPPSLRRSHRHAERSTPVSRRALIATMTVDGDVNTAPAAGDTRIPIGASTPAANGRATSS